MYIWGFWDIRVHVHVGIEFINFITTITYFTVIHCPYTETILHKNGG